MRGKTRDWMLRSAENTSSTIILEYYLISLANFRPVRMYLRFFARKDRCITVKVCYNTIYIFCAPGCNAITPCLLDARPPIPCVQAVLLPVDTFPGLHWHAVRYGGLWS